MQNGYTEPKQTLQTEHPVALDEHITCSASNSPCRSPEGVAQSPDETQDCQTSSTLCHRLKLKLGLGTEKNTIGGETAETPAEAQIEDFRSGYPQFSALIGSHASFHVYRRFLRARARLLLLKQDEVSLLESQLDHIDHEEERDLFLGNSRRDKNPERKETLGKLDAALSDYDAFLDRNRKALAYDVPRKNDVTNLQNWVDNTSSLAEDETAYLSHSKDLMAILSPQDHVLARLEPLLEKTMRGLYRILRKPQSDISRNPSISILPASLSQKLTRSLIAWLVVLFLLVPIALINALASTALRLAVIVIASALLIASLSSFTKAKTIEVFASGAT